VKKQLVPLIKYDPPRCFTASITCSDIRRFGGCLVYAHPATPNQGQPNILATDSSTPISPKFWRGLKSWASNQTLAYDTSQCENFDMATANHNSNSPLFAFGC
jgi:hypothetical protein